MIDANTSIKYVYFDYETNSWYTSDNESEFRKQLRHRAPVTIHAVEVGSGVVVYAAGHNLTEAGIRLAYHRHGRVLTQ